MNIIKSIECGLIGNFNCWLGTETLTMFAVPVSNFIGTL